jgi:hypothetical protein
MIVLVYGKNYKCYWDDGIVHVFLVDGAMLTIGMEDRGENRVSTASPRSRRPGEEGKTKE